MRITIAQWLVDLAQTRCPGDPIDLIPNAVDLNVQPTAFAAINTDRRHDVFAGTVQGLSASTCRGTRRKTIPKLKLIAFGTQSPNGTIPLPHDTHFTREPSQELIPRLYSSCDAWLFASRSEGFGLPLLEAMACRTPVIATPAGAAPELLHPGGGILINPNDPQMMADAIRGCVGDDTTWRVMSDVARADHRAAHLAGRDHRYGSCPAPAAAHSGNLPKSPPHPIRKAEQTIPSASMHAGYTIARQIPSTSP